MLPEDRAVVEVVSRLGQALAQAALSIGQAQAGALHAVFTGDDEALNAYGETFREAFHLGVELLKDVYTEVRESVANITSYDAGRILGRVAGEVLIQVLPALVSGGASLAVTLTAKAAAMAGVAAKVATAAATYAKHQGLITRVASRVHDFIQVLADAGQMIGTIEQLIQEESQASARATQFWRVEKVASRRVGSCSF
jgi:hypothetical protein